MPMISLRFARRALVIAALFALGAGFAGVVSGRSNLAGWLWAAGAIPVISSLAISIVRDLLAGRMGVDAIALLSMVAALALGENLAGIVVAIMYAGGSVLEDFAIGRAERDLKLLVDRAPGWRIAGSTNRSKTSPFRSGIRFSCARARSCPWMG